MTELNKDFFPNAVEKLFELSKNAYALKSDLNDLQEQIRILAVFMREYLKEPLYIKKNALIVRLINSNLKNGLTINEAILKTSEKLQEPLKRCQSVFNFEKHQKKQMEKYALLYMIERLEKARLSKKRIAKITGYSEKYLYELKKRQLERQKAS
mgnify:CR=1 FL=1